MDVDARPKHKKPKPPASEAGTGTAITTRRSFVAGATGALAALAARALGRVTAAHAADGDPLIIGGDNVGETTTDLSMTGSSPFGALSVLAADVAIEGDADGPDGIGVEGIAFSDGGTGVWGDGRGNFASGTGVRGAAEGAGTGVFGHASSGLPSRTTKVGVEGYADMDATSRGVYGHTTTGTGVSGSSTTGTGVDGNATVGIGVRGTNGLTSNPAMRGQANGNSTAVQGVSGSGLPALQQKVGVHGYAVQDSTARGVYGESTSGTGAHGQATSGVGVLGEHTATTGTNPGVRGRTVSTSGSAIGVHGLVDTTGAGSTSAGVRGENKGTGALGMGVHGSQAGSGWGVYGTVTGAGIGVRGYAPSGTGVDGVTTTGFGVHGEATIGNGVFGEATDAGGTGVQGMAPSGIGVGGYSTSGNGVFASSISGTAVAAVSGSSIGVDAFTGATSLSPAVRGVAEGDTTGVVGASGAIPPSIPFKTGVYGYAAQDATSVGVWGGSPGTGVLGTTVGGGTAGRFAAPADATALEVAGTAVFSRSGVATVPAGASSVTVPGVVLSADSLILATLQKLRTGVWVAAAVPNLAGSSFTIHLNQAVAQNTKVGWFVAN